MNNYWLHGLAMFLWRLELLLLTAVLLVVAYRLFGYIGMAIVSILALAAYSQYPPKPGRTHS